MGCKIPSHFFFKFAPAGLNVCEVEFTSVEYDVSRGGEVLLCWLKFLMKIDIQIEGAENYQVDRQVGRVVVKDTARITGIWTFMAVGCSQDVRNWSHWIIYVHSGGISWCRSPLLFTDGFISLFDSCSPVVMGCPLQPPDRSATYQVEGPIRIYKFTKFLTYVVPFLFIATVYIRPPSVRAVYVRSCLTSFCFPSKGTSATDTALPYARQPPLLSHLVSRVGLRRVLYCIPECTGSYFWENRLKALQSGGKLSEVQISTWDQQRERNF
jgi:hypothetical protein